MTKIDVYSGFLGAGKTTLIKKLLDEGYKGEKIVLIENEFGEIGIDSGFLQDAGINITEMNSGCICCSLVGDFGKALTQVIADYAPDRIIIEPSGVGKLSDVVAAVNKVTNADVKLGYQVAVVDAGKVKVYTKNFGEFYNNQVETATAIILSRTGDISQEKLTKAMELLRQLNPTATIVTTPWEELSAAQIMDAFAGNSTLEADLAALEEEHHHHDEEHHCCGHHHDDEEHHCCGHHHDKEHHHQHEDGHHGCGHHGHHNDEEHHCCDHHHHDHEEHHCCGHHHGDEHHHHHEDGHHCCGHHDHHHDHHADEVFTSWGTETTAKFTAAEIENALQLLDSGRFGMILRAKGIVAGADGEWIHFDYVPGEQNVRTGAAAIIGKVCVIGAQLDSDGVAKVFGI